MANIPTTENAARSKKISEKYLLMRKELWPEIDDSVLWNRKQRDGYTTVPRGLPYVMRIQDAIATKGQPISNTYLDLWFRMYDQSFIQLNKPADMAYASGFSGPRKVQTWTQRIDALTNLGFLLLAPGPNGPRSFALVLNPYFVVRSLKASALYKDKIRPEDWNALSTRLIEIGANDLTSNPVLAPQAQF